MTRRVLVVEDDPDIGRLLSLQLAELGCQSRVVDDGIQGLDEARSGRYDLVVLDLMLPRMDGLEVCRRLREEPRYTPILMLTAKTSEQDRVIGLEMGADDYLGKPFSMLEFAARVKAVFRRADRQRAESADNFARPNSGEVIVHGRLRIDVPNREATLDGVPIDLTAKEFDLLTHFARNPRRVYSRGQLLQLVWGHNYTGYEHTVNTHINRLRGKIEADPANPAFIRTVWGVGYKFGDPEGDAPQNRADDRSTVAAM